MPANDEAILVHVVNQPAEKGHTRVRAEGADHAHYYQVVAPVAGNDTPVEVGGYNPNRSRLHVWVNAMAGQSVWFSTSQGNLDGMKQNGASFSSTGQTMDHLSKAPLYAVTTGGAAITLNCLEETLDPE
jgi:hypothetical protein